MQHVIEAAADAAFQQYADATERASRLRPGDQIDLEDSTFAEVREWRGVYVACCRALVEEVPTGDHWL